MKKTELRLQLYGSPLLRKRCLEVEKIDFRIRELLSSMVTLMRMKKGVGLAANQAGLELRLVVIETPERLYRMINPRITAQKGRIFFDEGCLSFPGINLRIKRAREVWVNYLNEEGFAIDLKAEGSLAVILQHEIDHINGILFIDRVPVWQRLKLIPQLKKIKQLSKKGER